MNNINLLPLTGNVHNWYITAIGIILLIIIAISIYQWFRDHGYF